MRGVVGVLWPPTVASEVCRVVPGNLLPTRVVFELVSGPMVERPADGDASSPEPSLIVALTLRRDVLPNSEAVLRTVFIRVRKVIVEIVN